MVVTTIMVITIMGIDDLDMDIIIAMEIDIIMEDGIVLLMVNMDIIEIEVITNAHIIIDRMCEE